MRRTIIDTTNLELTDKVVSIKRVTKVVKGGRNMRFTALVVVGDGNGHVGVGLGKSIEIPEAIRKGKEDAAKHLVSVALDENNSVTHDFLGNYSNYVKRIEVIHQTLAAETDRHCSRLNQCQTNRHISCDGGQFFTPLFPISLHFFQLRDRNR